MKGKKIVSISVLIALLFSVSACMKNTPSSPTEPKTASPTIPVINNNTPAPPPEEETTSDEPALPPLEFSPRKAVRLGDIDSDIYGNLTFYYQDARLVIQDEYDSTLFTLYAQGYAPDGMAYELPRNGDGTEEDPTEEEPTEEEPTEEEPTEEETTVPSEDEDFISEDGEKLIEIELIGEDLNFDGYTDFRLLYSRGNMNDYYFCWLWDMAKRTFIYYLPLSSVPSPEFNSDKRRVISSDRMNPTTVISTEYIWQNGEIVPVAHGETTFSEDATGKDGIEDVSTSVSIFDNRVLSYIDLNINEDTSSRWICKIENERVVKLYSDTIDPDRGTHRFTFRGVGVGTTTVVLRYTTAWNAGYVAERIFNITVTRDGRLKIVTIE